MKHWCFLLAIIAFAGWSGTFFASHSTATPQIPMRESAYDRMMRSNELRCGYILYDPMVRKDPNTGAFSGIAVEITEAIGKALNIKIKWAEEVAWGTAVEGLRSNRYDALCIGFWRLPAEGKFLYYTQPFAYSLLNIIVRADDARFDHDITALNVPAIRLISTDGMEATRIAGRDFPRAHLIELPNMQGDTDMMESVASGKADATFIEAATAAAYNAANPNKLKALRLEAPIRIYQNTLALPQDEKLKATIDTALNDLIENGAVDIILNKYDPQHHLFLRMKRPMMESAP